MCGFGGVINFPRATSRAELASIASKVKFRGPDSCGIRVLDDQLQTSESGPHGIFFNRLAIIDLDKRSDQPFEDERYLLVFNGEIYNYRELKSEFEKKGKQFRTTSDTEVLFYALQEWGAEGLKKLNGMFAFFWLDKLKRKLIIARDRLGIKPLYYSIDAKTFTYASELDTIKAFRPGSATINSDAVDMYLWMQFVPTPHTIIRDINKLPPGHYLELEIDNPSRSSPTKFWDAYDFVSSANNVDGKSLEKILKDSLQRQLHADVPLGSFLSSGVDSSLLAALMSKYFSANHPVNFFTVRFEENTNSDESAEAREFIAKFNNPNLHCTTIAVNPNLLQDHLNDLYTYYDEPFGDLASLLNWIISAKAREFVTVAISGDGADELFWGYPRYQRWQQFTRLSKVPVLSEMARISGRFIDGKIGNNTQFVLEKDPVKRHFNQFLPSGMRFKINNHIVNHRMWALDGVEKLDNREDFPALLDIKTYLADAMLYKVDRSSMASSLEVRVPYLDNEVIDYALAMPLSEKSTDKFKTKAPLKELLLQLAPHYSLYQQKKGFNFPLRDWLKNNWKELVISTITRDRLQTAGLDPKPYLRIVNDFYRSRNDYFTDVWYIFNLALWMIKNERR
jgi:asparagine synthase (glutamine-hydrolysing)